MCCILKSKKCVFVPTASQRLEEFFCFCNDIETHPFFLAYKNGGNFQLKCEFTEFGVDSATLSFDEYHLESLLTRLRQFFFRNELFYYKDLRKATKEMFGLNRTFDMFYEKLVKATNKPFPKTNVQTFKADGTDVVENYTLPELIEARLYTGAIHSIKRIDPNAQPAAKGISKSHVAVSKHLSFVLAGAAMKAVQNICCFRHHIYLLAKIDNKLSMFRELEEIDKKLCT